MRRSAFLKTLPMIHPRESPVTTSFVSVASRFNASHVCTGITLSESRINRNRKLMLSCAEAVEEETCLWKGKEKAERIPGHGFTRINLFLFCPQTLRPSSFFYLEENKGTTEAVPFIRVIRENPRLDFSPAPHPKTPATSANAMDAAASATPSPRFGECVRESRQMTGPLLPACAPNRLPDQIAS
jgi:hypothetical protein